VIGNAGRTLITKFFQTETQTLRSIFSLKNEPEGGSEAIRRRVPFLVLVLERGQQVGKWETCFWFSTFPRVAEAVGMWESRSDFQGLWQTTENLGLVFLVFHAPVISLASAVLYALRLWCKRANSLRFASCISLAA
jgi:hypothetical protein